jgi:hypothetical protein
MYRDDVLKQANEGGLHGDVAMRPISALPKSAKPIKGNKIALGESTGHHHVLDMPGVKLYEAPAAELDPTEVDVQRLQALFGADVKVMIAEVPVETPLRHQEHGTQVYAPGIYWVPRQFEFPLGEPVRVTD